MSGELQRKVLSWQFRIKAQWTQEHDSEQCFGLFVLKLVVSGENLELGPVTPELGGFQGNIP